jgi:Flp pilus assembly protein CpaB
MTYRLRNIGLAIALAAVAVLLVFYYVAQERGRLQDNQELVPVWVAAKDIPKGTTGEQLQSGGFIEETKVERIQVSPGALLEPKDVVGEVVVEPIYRGEQVSQLRFRSETQRGIRAQLTGNLRAVQVPGNEHQLLAGTLQAGDRVDVIGTWNVPEQTTHHVSRVILRDILVLEGAKKADSTSRISQGPNQQISVKLALTDAQEQKLFWMAQNGEFTLALRPPADPADSPESVENYQTLLADGLSATQVQRLYESLERKVGLR